MVMKVQVPPGTSCVGHGGEHYIPNDDGIVEVPDALAKNLVASHGFAHEGARPRAVAPVANDDDLVTDDENDAPSPKDFANSMTQKDMKMYLRERGVGIPKGGTVGELRELVETTYELHLLDERDRLESHFNPDTGHSNPGIGDSATLPRDADLKGGAVGAGDSRERQGIIDKPQSRSTTEGATQGAARPGADMGFNSLAGIGQTDADKEAAAKDAEAAAKDAEAAAKDATDKEAANKASGRTPANNGKKD